MDSWYKEKPENFMRKLNSFSDHIKLAFKSDKESINFLDINIFWVGHPPLYVTFSVCLSICPSTCLSVCHAAYLRNCTSSNHNLWYTNLKWYLQVIFSFFQNLDFLDPLGWGEGNCDFWYTCVKLWYLQQSFSFFKMLIFGVCRE